MVIECFFSQPEVVCEIVLAILPQILELISKRDRQKCSESIFANIKGIHSGSDMKKHM